MIRGTVRDVDGRPLANARVMYAAAPAPVPDLAALTDAEGSFSLEAPGTGTYEVMIVADGYGRAHLAVEVSDTGEAEVNAVLERVD